MAGKRKGNPEGGETDNLEIICGMGRGRKNNLIRAGKQKAHRAARGYENTEGRAQRGSGKNKSSAEIRGKVRDGK